MQHFDSPALLLRISIGTLKGKTTEGSCNSCKFGAAMLKQLLEYGKGQNEISTIAKYLCTTLNIETERVCLGVINEFEDELITVAKNLTVSPNEICGVLIGDSCHQVDNPMYNWSLSLTPIPKPPPVPVPPPKPNSPVIKLVHLSDTHVDLKYREDSNANCGEPLCCRNTSGPIPVSDRAGYWGDYRSCDVPMRTFEQILKNINESHKDIDYVIWTGDIPPHDVWDQTRDGQIELIRQEAQMIDKYLGNLPIFPAIGNHESAPVNSFPTPDIAGKNSISWLYDVIHDLWSRWLPPEALKNVKRGVFYSAQVRPGLKLVSLNMNYCNNQNWWLLLNTTDPAGQLQWLINELQASELIGEKVQIIGHIPPGSADCLQVWSRNYHRIINRFESTITGQFFGHTHQDEFEIFYDDNSIGESSDGLRPTNVAYVGPSATTFGNVNPGYRIYIVDGDRSEPTFALVDHQTYYFNLTEANWFGNRRDPIFRLSYSAKSFYGLPQLRPEDWHNLVVRMLNDDNLFRRFYKLAYNRSDYPDQKCNDQKCKQNILCRLISAKSHDRTLCKNFFKKF